MSVTPDVSYPVSGGPGYGVTDLPRYLGGGFKPTDLTGLQLWLRADSLSLSDGDSVSTWEDESGQGNDATQGTAASQPTFKTGVVNGKPVVRFDGSDDRLASSFTLTQPETVLAVVRVVSGGYANTTVIWDGDSKNSMLFDMQASPNDMSIFSGTRLLANAYDASDNNALLAMCLYDGTNSIIDINDGEARNTGDAGTLDGGGISLGAKADGSLNANVDIVEIATYGRRLSVSERDQVQSYLNSKYAIF